MTIYCYPEYSVRKGRVNIDMTEGYVEPDTDHVEFSADGDGEPIIVAECEHLIANAPARPDYRVTCARAVLAYLGYSR